jgi:hypothetical protein
MSKTQRQWTAFGLLIDALVLFGLACMPGNGQAVFAAGMSGVLAAASLIIWHGPRRH